MDFPKSVPGVGLVNNQFVDEDPVNGTPGSLIPAKWGNDVTKEILGVIEEGGIAPDENNPQQLREAVVAIVDKVAPVATEADIEEEDESLADNIKRMTWRRVLQAIKARLINATESVAGLLRIGTQVETDAGVLDAVAVTPKKLRWGFMASFTQNGYIVFPSWLLGFMIVWGTGATVSSTVTVSHALAFPNGAIAAISSHSSGSGGIATSWANITATSIKLNMASGNGSVWYVAIGN